MKNIMKSFLVVLLTVFYVVVSAQNIQPSMMVLPYTKSGESALGLYEEQKEYRAIIAGIEQAIIDRGGELRDLREQNINDFEYIYPKRGRILSKDGIVLAEDRKIYSIAIDLEQKPSERSIQIFANTFSNKIDFSLSIITTRFISFFFFFCLNFLLGNKSCSL